MYYVAHLLMKVSVGVLAPIRSFSITFLVCSRSLMDKMLVCGTSAPGSIPGGSTNSNGPDANASGPLLFVLLYRKHGDKSIITLSRNEV